MATLPTPIVANTLPTWVITWEKFIKAHEKLIIVGLAALLLWKVDGSIEKILLNRASDKAQQAATVVKTDDTANKALQDQLTQMKATADSQSASLNAQISSQLAALKKQQAVDAAATARQNDARWQALLSLKPGSVVSGPTGTNVSDEAVSQTTQALEQIPVLKNQVSALTTELVSEEAIVTQQDNSIEGLAQEVTDLKTKDAADIKLERDKAKHSFWKGLKVGVVIGAVGTEVIRILGLDTLK